VPQYRTNCRTSSSLNHKWELKLDSKPIW
jgi:hypothetical protein